MTCGRIIDPPFLFDGIAPTFKAKSEGDYYAKIDAKAVG